MAKARNRELLPMLAGIFSLFLTFQQICGFIGAKWSWGMLLMPALWLLLGLCLLLQKEDWLTLVALLPVTLLIAQGAWTPLPLDSLKVLVMKLLNTVLPAVSYVVLFVLMLLHCMNKAAKFRRTLWYLPMILMLPGCVMSYSSAVVWAQFGMVTCISLWAKPARK